MADIIDWLRNIDEWVRSDDPRYEEAADEIEQLRRTLQNIRDERADVVEVREEQMLAEIRRRGEERDLLMRELENFKAQMREVNLVAWKRDAEEVERLRAEVETLGAETMDADKEIERLRTLASDRYAEIERLRGVLEIVDELPKMRADQMIDEIGQLVDALDSKEDPWAENSRLLAEVHELRAEVERLREASEQND